jgi:hypothetical protein
MSKIPEKIIYLVGGTIEVRGQVCKIVKAYPFGTLDVEDTNGRRFRVTGLRIYK